LAIVVFVVAAVALRSLIRSRRQSQPVSASSMADRCSVQHAAILSAAAILIGIAYLFTPYSAQLDVNGLPTFAWVDVRYVVPALMLGASCAAWLTDRSGRFRSVLLFVAILAVLEAGHRSFLGPIPHVSASRVAWVGA